MYLYYTHDVHDEEEVEKIHWFFMGLNAKTYGNIRSRILNLEPLLSLNKIYSMIT